MDSHELSTTPTHVGQTAQFAAGDQVRYTSNIGYLASTAIIVSQDGNIALVNVHGEQRRLNLTTRTLMCTNLACSQVSEHQELCDDEEYPEQWPDAEAAAFAYWYVNKHD